MASGRELKRRAQAAIAPLVFLAITGYFGWSATQGNHGLVAYAQRQALLRQAEQSMPRRRRTVTAGSGGWPDCGPTISIRTPSMSGPGRC